MRSVRRLLGVVLLIAVSLSAQLPPDVPRHETFIANVLTGRAANPGNFNQWATWVWQDRGIHNLLLEPLWIVDFATGKIINALASTGPVYNNDFTELTIKLRRGVFWSDGTPFTADDVVYTIELIKRTPGMAYNPQMQEVKEVKRIDAYTVLVVLNRPNARFHTIWLDRWGALRPLPKHVFEKVKDPLTFTFNPPIGTGPYVLKSFDPGGYWTLWERRSDWNRTPTGILFGMPQPKFVLFVAHGAVEQQILSMAQHQLDAADVTIAALLAMQRQIPTARTWRREYPWTVNIDPAVTGICLNTAVPPFNNREVRWALTLAINIVDYAVNAFDGAVTLTPIHVPLTKAYYDWYYLRMDSWLRNFELEIAPGQKFRPYDPDAGLKLAEYARRRGYPVPTDPTVLRRIFGPGWWKYAPDVAERLLLKNGFRRDRAGKWLLPDGTPWKITITTTTSLTHPGYRNMFAVSQEWRKFGIDVTVVTTDAHNTLAQTGRFEVSHHWPAAEPWGGHPDLYRTLHPFLSEYVVPVGENIPWGNYARWSSPAMDEVVNKLRVTPWERTADLINIGIEGLKILVSEMVNIPTFNYPGVLVWDEYYWTNYPGAENMYAQPYHHWPNFKYLLTFLKPTGRK